MTAVCDRLSYHLAGKKKKNSEVQRLSNSLEVTQSYVSDLGLELSESLQGSYSNLIGLPCSSVSHFF